MSSLVSWFRAVENEYGEERKEVGSEDARIDICGEVLVLLLTFLFERSVIFGARTTKLSKVFRTCDPKLSGESMPRALCVFAYILRQKEVVMTSLCLSFEILTRGCISSQLSVSK